MNMARSSNFMSIFRDQKGWRTCFRSSIFPATSLFFLVLFVWSTVTTRQNKEKLSLWNLQSNISKINTCERVQKTVSEFQLINVTKGSANMVHGYIFVYNITQLFKNQCRPPGSETLPQGIVAKTSNLERRPLWGSPKKTNASRSLLAVAVGIKQKINADKMVQKFLDSDFVVMLFHYDGIVDEWKDFKWSSSVIHVSADNQTKWWFAKRFLHPDIVAEYDYIFLWDEDLGVRNFHPGRYLSIVKDEGFEISQPALDIEKSEVHHLITARWRRSKVHRRTYKHDGKGIQCDDNSSGPPCTGWIEVMAPVFSKAAWRCVWYMIQNDLIHAWGLDIRLGYCAQGDRTKNIGVVDAEYIVHHGLPTLGEPDKAKLAASRGETAKEKKEPSQSIAINQRIEVRRQSYNEFKVFRRRWKKVAESDEFWVDVYPDEQLKQGSLWPQI